MVVYIHMNYEMNGEYFFYLLTDDEDQITKRHVHLV